VKLQLTIIYKPHSSLHAVNVKA